MEERVRNAQLTVAAQKVHAGAWAALQGVTDPVELHAAMTAQVAACRDSTQNGGKVAAEIWEFLKEQDDAFVATLQIQADEIGALLELLARQVVDFEQTCKEQLEIVESLYNEVSCFFACKC
jgi:hypothetical protein